MIDKNERVDIKYSVVVPVYQNAATVDRCIQSIIEQNSDNFELIVVDDGSTDGCDKVVERYLSDSRVAYYHISHCGVSAARNYGIEQAKGEYVLFCDADDEFLPGIFEVLLKHADGNNDIVVFGAEIKNCDQAFILNDILTPAVTYTGDEVLNALYGEASARPFIWNSCYKREFVLANNIRFCEKIDLGEDHIFQFKAFIDAKQVRFISDKLYRHYFCSPTSCNRKYLYNPGERMKKHFQIVEEINNLFVTSDAPRDERFAKWAIDFLFRGIIPMNLKLRKSVTPHCKELLNSLELEKLLNHKGYIRRIKILSSICLQNLYIIYRKVVPRRK